MMLGWMIYIIAVTLLLGVAALAVERALRLYGRPTRYAWVAVPLGAGLVPALVAVARSWLPSDGATAALLLPGGLSPAAWSASGPAVVRGDTEAALSLDLTLGVVWLVVSGVLLAALVWSALRLRRERGSWAPGEVTGVPVWFSRDLGPAVVGIARSHIVVPRWVLRLAREVQALVVRHEDEHRRAGDARLVFFGLAAAVLAPWNLPLWWVLHRLRLAIEVDCDRRVLAGGAPLRSYANALLAVRRHRARSALAAMAFARPSSALGRRIAIMTQDSMRARLLRAGAYGATALGLVALACDMPTPQEPGPDVVPDEIATEASATEAIEGLPVFVVDGVIWAAQLDGATGGIDVDTLDIERIEVLRGATGERYLRSLTTEQAQESDGRWVRAVQHGVVAVTTKGGGRRRVLPLSEREESNSTPATEHTVTVLERASAAEPVTVTPRDPNAVSLTSESEDKKPLYVVDGVIVAAPLEIEPERIESVEVIRGEAAVAQYGARAKNGVIKVTTKKQ